MPTRPGNPRILALAASTPARQLVVLPDFGKKGYIERFAQATGLRTLLSRDWVRSQSYDALSPGEAVIFDRLGVALVNAAPAHLMSIGLQSARDMEVEHVVKAFDPPETNGLARNGCRDDTALEAWGLAATGANAWRDAGNGVRVCVMDTGVDLSHPDIARMSSGPAQAFDGSSTVQLTTGGHATHCTGIICGARPLPPPAPGAQPWRYSVSPGIELAFARVVDQQRLAPDGRVLAALNWAVEEGCDIVSMSFGFQWSGADYSEPFEVAAQNALAAGTVIIAGTGNSSARPGSVGSTFHPARCPTIVAVGSVDFCDNLSMFSNGFVPGAGGKVDIVGPGEGVWSATINHDHFANFGTSMATAFVAGIAALHKAANPKLTGAGLRQALLTHFRTLAFPATAVGVGLALAPPPPSPPEKRKPPKKKDPKPKPKPKRPPPKPAVRPARKK